MNTAFVVRGVMIMHPALLKSLRQAADFRLRYEIERMLQAAAEEIHPLEIIANRP